MTLPVHVVKIQDDPTILERLGTKFLVADGCWEWTGAHGAGGYGSFWCNKRLTPAHRVVYELLVGPIPEGLQLDHLCRNKLCVRPSHLEPVTMLENIRRGNKGGSKRKTHCKRGHALEEGNLYYFNVGTRKDRACLACRKMRSWRNE